MNIWLPWWFRGPQCVFPIPFRVRSALKMGSWHRSSLASDEDYTLFTVIIFRKVYDAFVQKCRENKYEKIYRPIHAPLVFLTLFSKIRRKRLSVFIRPN